MLSKASSPQFRLLESLYLFWQPVLSLEGVTGKGEQTRGAFENNAPPHQVMPPWPMEYVMYTLNAPTVVFYERTFHFPCLSSSYILTGHVTNMLVLRLTTLYTCTVGKIKCGAKCGVAVTVIIMWSAQTVQLCMIINFFKISFFDVILIRQWRVTEMSGDGEGSGNALRSGLNLGPWVYDTLAHWATEHLHAN